MKDIDFLPGKYREATVERHAQYWRIVVLVMFGGLICAAVIGQYGIRRNVEQQAAVVRLQHSAAMNEMTRLAALDQGLKPHRVKAELLTFLRHPWPMTQIVGQALAPLPDSITLSKLHVDREPLAGTAPAIGATVSEAPSTATVGPAPLPVERDLQRLRQEADTSQVVVTLEGLADDESSLHAYVGQLASVGLFARAELTSIEGDRDENASGSRFQIRLVVRPGYGQKGGPRTAPKPASTPAPRADQVVERGTL